jgi:hypothetical protein
LFLGYTEAFALVYALLAGAVYIHATIPPAPKCPNTAENNTKSTPHFGKIMCKNGTLVQFSALNCERAVSHRCDEY